MKNAVLTFFLFCIGMSVFGQNQTREHIPTASAEALVLLENYLDRTEQDILNTLDSIPEAIQRYHPTETAWSIKQILEHIIQADKGVFSQIQKALNTQADTIESLKQHDAWLIAKVSDRGVKVRTGLPAPESTKSITELRQEFIRVRATIKAFLAKSDLPLRSHYGKSPYGKADCYQMFLVLTAHSMRHHHQMLDNISQFHSK